MTPYERDRLHEVLQTIEEIRPKLDPGPWSAAFESFERHLSKTLAGFIPVGAPEAVMLAKKVRRLLVAAICFNAYGKEGWRIEGVETALSLQEGLADLGRRAAFAREVEVGVVAEPDRVRELLGVVVEAMEDVGKELAAAVTRADRDPEARKEQQKLEKMLRRLEEARRDCKRFLDEVKEIAAERVNADA